ncbi:MAG TPA: CPBP family glutamic-type intramembrane protease [Candidatus Limnocylindrales bacterium]|nr:CPBP family glutamic-type intramembrane protease [Candidatus Limnocylindrales bacterium]
MIGGRLADARPTLGAQLEGSRRDWLRAAGLLGGLAAIVAARLATTIAATSSELVIGLVFGIALISLGIVGGRRLVRPTLAAIPIGLAGGAMLVGLALVARAGGAGPSLAPAAAFAPWAGVTLLVAGGEELVLRGALFTVLERAAGVAVALAVTSLAFALMHVPLYGWHVVPLDLGVGIFLGGLRLAGGGWAGPAIAHAVADLATWWL